MFFGIRSPLSSLLLLFLLALVLTAPTSGWAQTASFAGRWETSFGAMELQQEGERVQGHYVMQGVRCRIDGKVERGRLQFTYHEPDVAGEGWFRLSPDGKSFAGKWRETGSPLWADWLGRRARPPKPPGFAGLWTTTYGRMRLIEDGDQLRGIYSGSGGSTISGKVDKKRFTFRYREPEASGEGWFELVDDGNGLEGKWKEQGSDQWQVWKARRVKPQPGLKWLVVIEARWESHLAQPEFAFGDMLKAFFNRAPHVQVRRRSFNDENDLQRWCKEVAYLAEPVVVCFATHGSKEGIEVAGKVIPPRVIAESLRYADSIELVHFSACLMMKEQLAGQILKQLGPQADFPISGYATVVDWAASAVIEFLYFDLVLVRGMKPEKAAEQVRLLFPTAGERPLARSVLPPAGFRILVPTADAPKPGTQKPSAEKPSAEKPSAEKPSAEKPSQGTR